MKLSNHLILSLLIILVPTMAAAIEEPDYKVIGQYDDFELRYYDSYIVPESPKSPSTSTSATT